MAKKRARTQGRFEVIVAGKSYWLDEPSYGQILDKQARINELQRQIEAAGDSLSERDELLVALHVAAEIMGGADGFADDYADDDALLGLKPSDVRHIMAAWQGLCVGTQEDNASGEDAFRG